MGYIFFLKTSAKKSWFFLFSFTWQHGAKVRKIHGLRGLLEREGEARRGSKEIKGRSKNKQSANILIK